MPQAQQRDQLRSEEQVEFPITGPFGGVQSELPLTEIEQLGFADTRNILFRKGFASMRPGWTALPAFPLSPNEPILAVADFFNVNGVQIQCVITPTKLWQFISGGWTQITGPAFTGTTTQLFAWDVLNYLLCFSQGTDKLFTWDGIAATYQQVAAAQPLKYMAEIGLHLVGVNPTIPQRYYWTGIGDPTDWTSFSSGLDDNVNNLGPINGIKKIGQYGFGFHQKGILQIIPSGIGTSPFFFVPIINASQGAIAPYSISTFDDQGVEWASYLGIDNVYIFNGSSVEPIGDRPLDGRRRIGARSRILSDVQTVDPRTVYGFNTYSINGQVFRAYWLAVPGVSVWVYNYDEGNWTYFTYQKTLSTLGNFFKNSVIRIIDLVGTIAQQNWTPATLQGNNPFEGFLLGFNDGTAGYVDFTNYSEVAGQIQSGKIIFGDRRHKHTTRKYRLVIQDQGSTTYTITLVNEKGQSESHPFTLGTGSGDVLSFVQEFNITGLRIQWTVSVPANQPGGFVEFAPYYETAGEQRGGNLEN